MMVIRAGSIEDWILRAKDRKHVCANTSLDLLPRHHLRRQPVIRSDPVTCGRGGGHRLVVANHAIALKYLVIEEVATWGNRKAAAQPMRFGIFMSGTSRPRHRFVPASLSHHGRLVTRSGCEVRYRSPLGMMSAQVSPHLPMPRWASAYRFPGKASPCCTTAEYMSRFYRFGTVLRIQMRLNAYDFENTYK